MEWEKLVGILRTLNWVILLLLGSASFLFMSWTFTLGVIVGGLMIIANFNLLQHTIRKGFSSNGVLETKKASIIAKYYLRLAALGLLIYVLMRQQLVHPVGLTIGLSIIVMSIVALGIHLVWKSSSRGLI
jgi:hypothetical protein